MNFSSRKTTAPKSVRQAPGVDYGGRIAFTVDDQRIVFAQKAEVKETADPVIDGLL